MSTTFGRYTLVRRVGTGGMAEIWKAKVQGPQGFEKDVAIKRVLPHLVEDGEFIDMFVEEAKLVAGLVHPNIVQVFDFGRVGKNEYFIAMEYVGGANLAQVIRRLADRKARMPLEVALYIGLEATKGLGYAHGKTDAAGNPQGIVHRDVSPQNLLVSFGGEVKVTDFGIAKVASALTRTAEGHVRGKLAYMSPEQAHTKPLDNRSDLFSLGVVLYELVTGKRLFSGSSASEIYSKVTDFEPPPPDGLLGFPDEVATTLRTVLQPDPEERYQDAMQLEGALAHSLGPEGIVQARHALASMMQRLFEEERRLDMDTGSNAVVPAEDPMAGPTAAAASTQPSGQFASPGGTVISSNPPAPAAAPREVPRRTPTNPSGLTLAKGKDAAPGVRIAEVLPPSDRSRGMFLATAAVGVGLAIAAGAFAIGRMFGATATPVPTFTPPPIPIASIAEASPAAVVSAAPAQTAVVAVSAAPGTPTPTPVVVASTPAPAPRHTSEPRPTPEPRPTRVAVVAATGTLSVNARPWVQVWVDDKLVASETPLRRHSLPAGKHHVRFSNPASHFSTEAVVDIPPNGERAFFVDVRAGTVRPE